MTAVCDVLVDTSVWIDHFRHGNARLVALLSQDAVLMHPFVLLELACGTPPSPRQRTLADLARLRQVRQATTSELLQLIERETLYGQGCGMTDVSLLAATCITPGARLWTMDKSLRLLATRLEVAWQVSDH
jgi:predicted nucleic acid-binding protein